MIAAAIFGGLYYFFQDRDITDVQKAIGNPAVENQKTLREKKAEEEKINKYDVGDCIKISPKNTFEAFKITKVDVKKKDYHYKLCVKFKGCSTETKTEIISNFEYEYPPSFKTKCF